MAAHSPYDIEVPLHEQGKTSRLNGGPRCAVAEQYFTLLVCIRDAREISI
jgi:hypothetical protein